MAPTVKNPPASSRPGFNPWVGKIPWRRAQQPTHVFLSGESPLSTEELMLLNHSVGEDPWEPLGQQVNSKGNQSWIFNVRTEAESETPYFGHLMKELTHWKRPWFWERLKAGEGDDRGWDGWMASLTHWTWVWANSKRWWRTWKPGVLQSTGSQRVGHNWVAERRQPYTVWLFA